MPLADFQDAFADALQDSPASPTPDWMTALQSQPGFAVYRNSGRKASIDALRANYPSIERLVGEAWFLGAAQHYVAQHPPQDGRLMSYGDAFPAFLQGFVPAAELPYLPAVATLDRAWTQAHLAADAPVLPPTWMATLTAETLVTTQLVPHPAAQWYWCAEHPVYSIWQRQRDTDPTAADTPLEWQAEGALITRPNGAVQWCALPAAGITFLNACAAGHSLADAAAGAMTTSQAEPPVDFSQLVALLINAGALRAPQEPT